MKKTRLGKIIISCILLLVIGLSYLGYSWNHLSRAEAEEIIREHYKYPQKVTTTHIPKLIYRESVYEYLGLLKEAGFITISKDKDMNNRDEMFIRMMESSIKKKRKEYDPLFGTHKKHPEEQTVFPGVGVIIDSSSLAQKIHVHKYQISLTAKGKIDVVGRCKRQCFKVKLGEKRLVGVTGIRKLKDDELLVEYDWKYVLTPFGKAWKGGSDNELLMVISRGEEQLLNDKRVFKKRVHMLLYDNGWRIE